MVKDKQKFEGKNTVMNFLEDMITCFFTSVPCWWWGRGNHPLLFYYSGRLVSYGGFLSKISCKRKLIKTYGDPLLPVKKPFCLKTVLVHFWSSQLSTVFIPLIKSFHSTYIFFHKTTAPHLPPEVVSKHMGLQVTLLG